MQIIKMPNCLHDFQILSNISEIVRQSILFIRGKVVNNQSAEICAAKQEVVLQIGTDSFFTPCDNQEFRFVLELKKYGTLIEGQVVELLLRLKYCNKNCSYKVKLEKPKSAYKLQPIYILCADDDFDEDLVKRRCEQIDVNLRVVQAIFADRLSETLGKASTFVLNDVCKIFRSDIKRKEIWESDEHFLWNFFAEEFLRKSCFGDGKNVKLKIVAFIGCTKYNGFEVVASGDLSYANIRKHLKGHAALGGGDLALFGTGFLYAWPSRVDEVINCLRNTKKVNPALEPDESNYRRTYSGVYATTLGAVCHELGHVFDCGHTRDGIMGNGFDFLNRLLIITDRTENLPKRIVGNSIVPTVASKSALHSRLTKINRDTHGFLDNYREQRKSDGFYFTRNCAIILANNKWFKNIPDLQKKNVNITFDAANGVIVCKNQLLKIIEIRASSDGLVEKYFEFLKAQNEFKLEKTEIDKYVNTHFLYVLGDKGEHARFNLIKSDKENFD